VKALARTGISRKLKLIQTIPMDPMDIEHQSLLLILFMFPINRHNCEKQCVNIFRLIQAMPIVSYDEEGL